MEPHTEQMWTPGADRAGAGTGRAPRPRWRAALSSPALRFSLLGLALSAYVVVVLYKAWASDDAYLTFRTIDNFLHGHGLRWNVSERVQVYTHPLWMLALSALGALTHEFYYTSIFFGAALSVAAILLFALRLAPTVHVACLAVVLLTFSNAFTDYSTSGLENPLTHFLLVLFLVAYFRFESSYGGLVRLFLLAALLVTNRMDTAVILLPPLAYVCVRHRNRRTLLAAAAGAAPLVAWECFATLYYGFPFPNSAYAKLSTGIGGLELLAQGFRYAANSLLWDPLTLTATAAGVVLALARREARGAAVAAGIVFHLAYVLAIGGDFMSGRFFTPALLAAVVLISRSGIRPRLAWTLAGAVVLGACLTPIGPFATPPHATKWEVPIDDHGIADERRHYAEMTALRLARGQPVWPDPIGAREARMLEQKWDKDAAIRELKRMAIVATEESWPPATVQLPVEPRPLVVRGAVGLLAFALGPGMHVLDYHALGDALLARLPAEQSDPLTVVFLPRLAEHGWRIGHFVRRIPLGYVETQATGRNRIRDPDLVSYYEDLALVTQGRLLDPRRLAAIWKLNARRHDPRLHSYLQRLPPSPRWLPERRHVEP